MDQFTNTLIPMVAIFAIFYFFLIRPQQQRMKKHQEMVNAVRRGDTVVTAGGLIGKVVKVVDEREALIELGEGVKVRVVKSTLADVTAKGEPVSGESKSD